MSKKKKLNRIIFLLEKIALRLDIDISDAPKEVVMPDYSSYCNKCGLQLTDRYGDSMTEGVSCNGLDCPLG
jgi:hypothetical protein